MEAITLRLEAVSTRLEAITLRFLNVLFPLKQVLAGAFHGQDVVFFLVLCGASALPPCDVVVGDPMFGLASVCAFVVLPCAFACANS